ncbi:hypothetical protein J6590_064626 [Homalodisca vitripennis]|nr:hypothetical protein J6590_064626 [Homalodisca vitripennis]
MEFEEFVDFNVAVCGDVTNEDILASGQPSNPLEDEAAEDDKENARVGSGDVGLVPKNPLCDICGKVTNVTVRGANMVVFRCKKRSSLGATPPRPLSVWLDSDVGFPNFMFTVASVLENVRVLC